MPNNFNLVVMDNHQAKIWNQGIEPDSPKIVVDAIEPLEEHDARGREPRGNEADDSFLEEISTHLKNANAILLLGPGKGKASGVLHLQSYLKTKHPNIADKIYEIESVDMSHSSDAEFLAFARTEWSKYRQTH